MSAPAIEKLFSEMKLSGNSSRVYSNLDKLDTNSVLQILLNMPVYSMPSFCFTTEHVKQICKDPKNMVYIEDMIKSQTIDMLKEFLPESKGNTMYIDPEGNNTVMLSLKNRELLRRLILFYNVSVNCSNCKGNTVLIEALEITPYLVEELIKLGANVNAISQDKGTVLMQALEVLYDITIKNDENEPLYEKNVRLLIEAGADVNLVPDGQDSPLIIATGTGNSSIIRMLIESGADIGFINPDNEDALIYSIFEFPSLEVTRELLEAGAIVSWEHIALSCRPIEHGGNGMESDITDLLLEYYNKQ